MADILVIKNLNRWFKEKWVDVSRKDKDGKHPPCGRSKAKTSSKGYPKCRPSVRVSSKTPKTAGQMTSGQKQAATKRKRSKRQGGKGKPTVVKGDPMDIAFSILKAFPAKYAGNCSKCGQWFPAGTPIVSNPIHGGFMHDAQCAIDPLGRRY